MECRVMPAFSRSSCSAIRTRHLFPLGFAGLRAPRSPPSRPSARCARAGRIYAGGLAAGPVWLEVDDCDDANAERGDMTFRTVIEAMGGHDLNHLKQLETAVA